MGTWQKSGYQQNAAHNIDHRRRDIGRIVARDPCRAARSGGIHNGRHVKPKSRNSHCTRHDVQEPELKKVVHGHFSLKPETTYLSSNSVAGISHALCPYESYSAHRTAHFKDSCIFNEGAFHVDHEIPL